MLRADLGLQTPSADRGGRQVDALRRRQPRARGQTDGPLERTSARQPPHRKADKTVAGHWVPRKRSQNRFPWHGTSWPRKFTVSKCTKITFRFFLPEFD